MIFLPSKRLSKVHDREALTDELVDKAVAAYRQDDGQTRNGQLGPLVPTALSRRRGLRERGGTHREREDFRSVAGRDLLVRATASSEAYLLLAVGQQAEPPGARY